MGGQVTQTTETLSGTFSRARTGTGLIPAAPTNSLKGILALFSLDLIVKLTKVQKFLFQAGTHLQVGLLGVKIFETLSTSRTNLSSETLQLEDLICPRHAYWNCNAGMVSLEDFPTAM